MYIVHVFQLVDTTAYLFFFWKGVVEDQLEEYNLLSCFQMSIYIFEYVEWLPAYYFLSPFLMTVYIK